jgi:two-component system, sensor histidine kinase
MGPKNTNSSLPPHELRRLESLRQYHILDTNPEKEYEDLVALTAEICGTPTALISFVDEARQWFKARVNFKPQETPRDESFCSHALNLGAQEVLVVPDARTDPRFAQYPKLRDHPLVRFYAGAPLVTRDGHALGALCVIDQQPREFSEQQARTLRVLSRHVVNALELRRLVREQGDTIRRLQEARDTIDAARREAERTAEIKGRFIATMSHEIRTPLSAVLGISRLLEDTPLSLEQSSYIETIRASGEMLLSLLNDILDLSRIESGRLELESAPFDPAVSVRQAANLLAPTAQAKGLRLETRLDPDLPALVKGDFTRLNQILVNLVSNAVKFTRSGEVRIEASRPTRVRSAAEDGVDLEFRVSDTGIGIPPEQQGRLFQAFSQADPSISRQFGGTGLGLAICRQLVEMHGGRIAFESKPGRGTTFYFTLRFGRVDQPAAPGHAPGAMDKAPASPPAACRVLLVEDDPISRLVAERILRGRCEALTVSTNGREALAALEQADFDLVLMDMEMPEMDGTTAVVELRRRLPANRQPLVVALSAHSVASERERAVAAGMDDFLQKPVREQQLLTLLGRATEFRRGREVSGGSG